MRYAGQSYELPVPWLVLRSSSTPDPDPQEMFHRIHRQAYGYDRPGAPTEIVNVRVRVAGRGDPPSISASSLSGPDPSQASIGTRPVWFISNRSGLSSGCPDPAVKDIPFFRYELLRPGNLVAGPAIIVRADTTILIGESDRAAIDPYHNLVITIHPTAV